MKITKTFLTIQSVDYGRKLCVCLCMWKEKLPKCSARKLDFLGCNASYSPHITMPYRYYFLDVSENIEKLICPCCCSVLQTNKKYQKMLLTSFVYYLAKCWNSPPNFNDAILSVTCFGTLCSQKWHQNVAPGSSSPSMASGNLRYCLHSTTWIRIFWK